MRSARTGLGAVIAAAILLSAIPSPAKPKDDLSRTITVQLAVDRSIPNLTEWRFAANSFLEGAVRTFHTHFGIKLAFKGPIRWQPAGGRQTLEEALRDLSVKVPPDGCDIVLGIIDPDRVSSRTLGIASYINSCVLIGNDPDPGVMRYAVLHEMCHIFGAIDLGEKGSLMSMKGSSLSFDKFTSDAVALHKDRTFSRGAFPLPRANIEAAIKLYADRSSQRLGEPETQMFLTLFYLEKEDLDAASVASEEAAKEDPDMMGLEVLLGNIRLGHGRPDLAIAHYEKALKHEPADAGLHYNLGLAYATLGRFTEATEQCRESLRLNPGLVVARLGLARLYLAAGSAEAAAGECRKALQSDPRSAEALCLLGTAMVALERPFEPTPEAEKAPGLDVPNSVAPGSPEAELAAADAVKYLQMSIAIDPADPQAYISLGLALAAQHKYSEAEKSYLEALNIEPEDLDAHYGLGSMYLEMGNVHKAIFHLEQIMSIDPASDLGSRMVTGAFRIARAYPLFRRKADR